MPVLRRHLAVKVNLFLSTPWSHIGGPEVFLASALDLGECSNFTPRLLYQLEGTPVPLNRRLGGPQSRSGRFWRREDRFPLPGFEPRTVQPVGVCVTIHDLISF
jgi:hypothetical protein